MSHYPRSYLKSIKHLEAYTFCPHSVSRKELHVQVQSHNSMLVKPLGDGLWGAVSHPWSLPGCCAGWPLNFGQSTERNRQDDSICDLDAWPSRPVANRHSAHSRSHERAGIANIFSWWKRLASTWISNAWSQQVEQAYEKISCDCTMRFI